MTVQTGPVNAPVNAERVMSGRHTVCETIELPTEKRRRLGFWANVHKTDCCWLWTRARFPGTGYGAAWIDGKLLKAHRVAYEDAVGPIPAGLDVMHHCDVRHCVRPDHLEPATAAQNAQDMVAKGRNVPQRGEDNGHAKFTWAAIRAIRMRAAHGERHTALAAEYETSAAYISSIVRGRVWREADHSEEGAA
jgi:uncharacterized protein YciI